MKTAKKILILVEDFLKTVKMKDFGDYAEIIVNPNRSELMKHLKLYNDRLRFIADPATKKIYFFREEYLHENAHKDIGIHTQFEKCLSGVLVKEFGIKTKVDLYKPIGYEDWSWLNGYFDKDINKYIEDCYGS